MSTDHCTPAPAPEPAAAAQASPPADVHERLAYLFRATLRQGHIHPLYHLIQQYRLEERA